MCAVWWGLVRRILRKMPYIKNEHLPLACGGHDVHEKRYTRVCARVGCLVTFRTISKVESVNGSPLTRAAWQRNALASHPGVQLSPHARSVPPLYGYATPLALLRGPRAAFLCHA